MVEGKSSLKAEEERLYDPIKGALERTFGQIGECYLEKTPNGRFSPELKRVLPKDVLFILRVERFSPDLTGFLRKKDRSDKEIITVEVKPRNIKLKHIAQARLYGEILKAKYCLLISPQHMPVEIKIFVKENDALMRGAYSSSFSKVSVAKFNEKRGEFSFDRELYDSTPEPFKYLAGECSRCGRWSDFLTKIDYEFLCERCQQSFNVRK